MGQDGTGLTGARPGGQGRLHLEMIWVCWRLPGVTEPSGGSGEEPTDPALSPETRGVSLEADWLGRPGAWSCLCCGPWTSD